MKLHNLWYIKDIEHFLFTINFKVAWKGLVVSLWFESDAPEENNWAPDKLVQIK